MDLIFVGTNFPGFNYNDTFVGIKIRGHVLTEKKHSLGSWIRGNLQLVHVPHEI